MLWYIDKIGGKDTSNHIADLTNYSKLSCVTEFFLDINKIIEFSKVIEPSLFYYVEKEDEIKLNAVKTIIRKKIISVILMNNYDYS